MKRTSICLYLLFCLAPACAAEQKVASLGDCHLDSGAVIEDCRIGYRTFGSLNEARDNAILIPTWFTGTSENHEYMVAPNFIDPDRYFIVIVDALANGVSSSPSNSPSQPNEAFPEISIRDMVRTQHRLATELLELDGLYAVVGASMGGMQAFEWMTSYPGFAKKTVAAIGSPRLASFDVALWETEIRLFELFRACECAAPMEALAGLKMLTGNPEQLSQQIEAGSVDAELRRIAIAHGMTPEKSWDIQRQAEAMIGHDISRDFDHDMNKAAKAMQSELLIIVGRSDRVVTPQPALDFAEISGAAAVVLGGDCGHAAPWCEAEFYAATIKTFLD